MHNMHPLSEPKTEQMTKRFMIQETEEGTKTEAKEDATADVDDISNGVNTYKINEYRGR